MTRGAHLRDPCRGSPGFVADLGGDHAEVVLDHRVGGEAGGAVLEESQRALVQAAPGGDPAEGVGEAMIAHPHIRLDARGVAWIDDVHT